MAQRAEIDRLAEASPDIDRWCSSADWIIATYLAFSPEAGLLAGFAPGGAVLLSRHAFAETEVIAGIESVWGFACPVIGPEPQQALRAARDVLAADGQWTRLVIGGLRPGSERALLTVEELGPLGYSGASEPTVRLLAYLGDGFDQWFEARSPKFRRNLRRAERRAERAGLSFNVVTGPDVFDRALAVERLSWKGEAGDGIVSPTMSTLYRHLCQRLGERERLRAIFAQIDGHDVGFLLGAIGADRYRGLQVSYANSVRGLSVGHLLQLHEIRFCARAGISIYDLGMTMDYKVGWADSTFTTAGLVIDRVLER